jgi:phage terminase large subunit-like protein
MFGLRLGRNPRCLVATTPRPTRLIRELLAREGRMNKDKLTSNIAGLTINSLAPFIRLA